MKEKSRNLVARLSSLMLALLLLGAVAVTGFAAEADPACYGFGDVNGDNGVDGRDAIYTLYHVMFPESYPVNQDCDFNTDGSVDGKDAIEVLYGSLGMVSDCPLGETVHQYYAPQWNWAGPEAVKATFRCACGSITVLSQDTGITVTAEPMAERSCTQVGIQKYTASVTFGEKEYTSQYTVTIPATEHTMEGSRNCLEGSSCSVCGFSLPALGHDWAEDLEKSTAATCKTPGIQVFVCSREDCGETKTIELEGLAAHDFQYVCDSALETSCAFVKEYKCADCEETAKGETFYKHTYTAKLTREATCSTQGEKTLTCVCGDTKTEAVEVNDSHTWDAGVTDETGVTTFTCTGCGTTKTAVLVEGNQATVEKEALGTAELQLENASVKLDEQTLSELGDTIAIDVSILSAEDLSLDSSHAEQIGSNPVYDFNLYSDESQVSGFAGLITVTLPYTLQEGDDVDCIDVWFISDDGTVEIVQGTYANGFVTFQAEHFSYYTVTRLTPAQRCEKYGHAIGIDHQDPTCIRNGHHVEVCRRCGFEQENTVLERIPHNYKQTRVEPTCTEDGSFTDVCTECLQQISGKLPALGHAWNRSEEKSSAPGCVAAGKDVYICGNTGCTESYTEEIVALGHDYQLIGQVNSDCTTSGYEGYKCSACGDEYKSNEVSPMGHDFAPENAVWEWAEDCSAATVKLVCARNPEHTQVLTAVISKTVDAPNCDAGGEVIYKATAAFNLKEYTDSKTVRMDKVGHQAGDAWQNNGGVHYHACTVCGEMMDVSAHNWGTTTVITPAACNKAGSGKQTCTVCGYEQETVLNATGAHSFSGDVCTPCGFRKEDCTHRTRYQRDVDISTWGLCEGSRVWWAYCDCGETKYLNYDLRCAFGEQEEKEGTLPNGETGMIYTNTCTKCALVLESTSYAELDETSCTSCLFYWDRMSKNGTVLLEGNEASGEKIVHDTAILVETMDLKEKGLCGVVLKTYRCHCGARTYVGREESLCRWEHMGYEDKVETYCCMVCGATRTEKITDSTDLSNCKAGQTVVVTYRKGDTELYTYTNVYSWEEHSYQLEDYRMEGDSCEDGVYIQMKCAVCHKENSYHTNWHDTVDRKETDISALGLCADAYYQASCLCGQEKHFGLQYRNNPSCDWEYAGEDPATGAEISRCTQCGLQQNYRTTIGEKQEDCMAMRETVRRYTMEDGTLLVEGIEIWETQKHDMLVTRVLSGDSCEDGVTITEVCRDCGYTNSWTTKYHGANKMESYDLSDYGMCGGELALYNCACGYESWIDYGEEDCHWEWISGNDNTDTYYCKNCGVTRKNTHSEERKISDCRSEQDVSITFTKNNKTLLKMGYVQTIWNHRYTHTFVLNGTSCTDGYRVTETCVACGVSDSWNVTGENHGTWTISREMLVEGKLCSDVELVTNQCACGLYQSQSLHWTGKSCDYYGSSYVEAEDGWLYTCVDCGGQRLEKNQRVRSDDRCIETYQYLDVFYKDDVEICRVQRVNNKESHDWNYTYELLGTDCADGYYYTRTCPDCGLTRKNNSLNYGCWERQISRKVLLDNAQICGPVTLVEYDSPCGKDYRQSLVDNDCDWSYSGYESGVGDIYICDNCGLRRVGRSETLEETGCDIKRSLQYTYSLNGTILLEVDEVVRDKNHVETTSFELYGTSCEEGFGITYTCVYCGKKSESTSSGEHYTYRTAFYGLKEYGLCGGSIQKYSCACGQHTNWDFYDSGMCNWYNTDKTVDGMTEYYCAQCDTYRYSEESGSQNPDTCRYEGTFVQRFVRDDKTLLDIREEYSYPSHRAVMGSVTLANPDRGCEGGYRVTMVCQDCGAQTTTSSGSSHSTYTVEYVDLDDSFCGGTIVYGKCACGQESYVDYYFDCADRKTKSWTEEGADGYTHSFYQESCSVCGMEWVRDAHTIRDVDACKEIYKRTYTLRQNGTVIRTFKTQDVNIYHSYGNTIYQLAPGSVTCKDGIIETNSCKVCGYSYQSRSNSHSLGEVERMDLTAYGSVCGSDLALYACACGQYQRYDFTEDRPCDMDRKYIDHFVPGTIDTSQYTTNGWVRTDSASCIRTCAVTDPKCNLKLRISEYWLDEDCMATQYQILQLGYDEATGTWMKELKVATGEKHAYHPYVSSNSTETLDDGSVVEINTQVCPNCASSYITKDYSLEGAQTKREIIATNTKDNGENKRWYQVYEYGVENSGYRFNTLEREEYTYANGTEYWYQYAYEYDFPAGCVRTCTYTNSDGDRDVSRTTAHQTRWSSENLYDSTCTQFGAWVERWTCQICGTVTSEYTYDRDPVAHNWRYDSGKETYVCTICGLENINGASGSIVLEDVTEAWGSGTNYVVGYWNRGDVEARKYVSLILEDAEGEEVVLTDITFTTLRAEEDGITAISFSKAQVQAAADAILAERSYTGSYAIRFTFVPVGSEDTLDYAITFDSQSA